jgi:hypothetical protein
MLEASIPVLEYFVLFQFDINLIRSLVAKRFNFGKKIEQ